MSNPGMARWRALRGVTSRRTPGVDAGGDQATGFIEIERPSAPGAVKKGRTAFVDCLATLVTWYASTLVYRMLRNAILQVGYPKRLTSVSKRCIQKRNVAEWAFEAAASRPVAEIPAPA